MQVFKWGFFYSIRYILFKFFNTTKGFGFIQPESGGADVFVHISAVQRSGLTGLNEGQKISFELQQDPKRGKSSAVNLKPL